MKIHVIGSETVVVGYSLVGIRGTICSSSQEVYTALEVLLSNNTIGLIFITSKLAQMVADKLEEIKFSREFPLLIEIPDERNDYDTGKSVEQIMKQVVG